MGDSPQSVSIRIGGGLGVLGLIGRLRPMGETCFLLADKRRSTPGEDGYICSHALSLHELDLCLKGR